MKTLRSIIFKITWLVLIILVSAVQGNTSSVKSQNKNFNSFTYSANELNITMEFDSINYDIFIFKYLSFASSIDDMYDIIKFTNPTVNISSYGVDNIYHTLDARPSITANDTVFLNVSGAQGVYKFIFNNTPTSVLGKFYILRDEFLNTSTLLDNSTIYDFSITTNSSSYGNSRFKIIISNTSLLPVDFISFTASKNDNEQVNLFWSTASINQNSIFKIERSYKNEMFSEIGTINSKVNFNPINNFSFVDNDKQKGETVFYRIKEVDQDGKYVYSKTIYLTLQKEIVSIFPNPVNEVLHIRSSIKSNTANEISIYTIAGIFIEKFITTENNVDINISDLNEGEYFIVRSAIGDSSVDKIKFLKH